MRPVAAGMQLVADVVEQEPPRRRLGPGGRRVGRVGMGGDEALRAIEPVIGRGEAARGERCAFDPVRGGEPGIVGLAHRPELAAQPRSPRRAEPQRRAQAVAMKTHQAPRRDRRPEGSRRRGLVKAALVMPEPQLQPDADRNLGPQKKGIGHLACRRVELFGHRKRGRQDRDRRMPDMGEMRVVVVERVRRRTVDQSRGARRRRGAADDRGDRAPTLGHDHVAKNPRQRFTRPCPSADHPVEERQPCHRPARRRQLGGRKRGEGQDAVDSGHRGPAGWGV
jgi:hypothetical protein